MSGKKTNIKKRNWAFVVYPTKEQLDILKSEYDGSEGYGSVPDDWIQRLNLSGLQYAISPLHDKDKLEDESGRIKKPHYHVIVCYGSPTTYNNVKNLTDNLQCPIPQALEQVRGYYRYFTHKDNADKYQYDEKEIRVGGGFNIADFVELSKNEVTEIKKELQALIRNENITEYADFMDYLLDNEKTLEYDVASNNTYFFDKYIASKRHKSQQPIRTVKVDKETGEMLD